MIYQSRPEICSVDVMYEKYFHSQCTREEFYALNIEVCKVLKKLKESGNKPTP